MSSGARPPVMALPDILAMTTSGQPKPGRRVTLPSGAVWEGGQTEGTSTITLPGRGALLVDSGRSNGIVGESVSLDAVADAFAAAFGQVPKLFGEWMTADADGEGDTETRVVSVTSKTTFRNPARSRRRGGRRHEHEPDGEAIGLANGGRITGPGGPRDDAVLARLSDGEFVINAAATSHVLPLLEAINAGWVPSPAFLAGMLPGFAAGGPVGSPLADDRNWRNLLVAPRGTADPDSRWNALGLFGLAADAMDGIANAALNAGGRAGAALGAAVAPALGPGGLLRSLFGRQGGTGTPSAAATRGVDSPSASNPLMASLRVNPVGILGGSGGSGTLARLFGATPGLQAGLDPMGELSDALGTGMVDAATEAGGEVGAVLGAAIAPALGPAGALAPQIGAELGRLVGSEFGGSLSATMTLRGELPGGAQTAELGTASGPGDNTGAPDDPGSSSLALTPAGTPPNSIVGGGGAGGYSGLRVIQDPEGVSGGIPLEDLLSAVYGGPSGGGNPAHRGTPANGQQGASPLALAGTEYKAQSGDLAGLGLVTGARMGSSLGEALAPALGAAGGPAVLGSQLGGAAGAWLGSLAAALAPVLDPTGRWAGELEANLGGDLGASLYGELGKAFGMPGGPGAGSPFVVDQESLTADVLGGAIGGFAQGGLLGAVKGGLTGAASGVGGQLGAAIGSAVAPGIGTAVGGMLGSAIGQMGAAAVIEPVERVIGYTADTAKEVAGSGFGLVDLAKGPGGRTARGDIYNFNGMDPKSAAIAVERVRRRRTLAQQRGGGLGR
ncbi:hypothetical protein AB0H71_09930 [Nocardia sp. NPDC050697]|uniref:hypothetical protein n=1 Tax=Nocardia sp. NPDC050697 TaxID=3155158 RepID=UPI003410F448